MSERPPGRPLRLAASLEGSDRDPVLVLGNSLGTTRGLWDPQLPALAARFRLLRYELPGHGRPGTGAGAQPPPPPGPYSIADLGRAVLALLDERGIGRASYCGISLGGMIGMWLAAHAPDRIATLGLCCTSAHMPPASGWLDRAALVRTAGMAAVTGLALDRWFTPVFARSSPAVIAAIADMLDGTDPEGYAGCCEALATMDLRPSLGSVTAPTLVIAASEDPSTPPAHGALIARAIPGARLTVIRGAAHLANVQTPGPVTAALLEHLLVRDRD
jgi:3-oxoadipate enol-lactonase